MLRAAFLIGSTGFWLTMMSLLIQKEFFQLSTVKSALEVLPLYDSSVREEYQAIYLGDRRVGFGFTVLESSEGMKANKQILGATDFELRHQSYLSFRLLGRESEMLIRGKAKLDEKLTLKSFEFWLRTKDVLTHIKGDVKPGEVEVTVEEKGADPAKKSIPIQGPLLYSEASDLIWTPDNLRIGKRGRFQLWNPLMGGIEETEFRVDHKEEIIFDGKPAAAFVIFVKRGDFEARTWVSSEGVVLRRESSTGLLFQKEEGWQIFDAIRKERGALPDLPNLYSVPSNKILEDPSSLSKMSVIIKNGGEEASLEIKKWAPKNFGKVKLPLEMIDETFIPYLEPTPWIQSQDPAIEQKAREIIDGETSALQAVIKLMHWVHDYVEPAPTVSLPSARQVLQMKKGDCNEYTALFTALARSVSIPTKMIAGLVYQNGRFFYHAWAEVYLGAWVGIDPTFNEAPVNVTHIPLVEGELEQQVALAYQLGKTKIFITKTE